MMKYILGPYRGSYIVALYSSLRAQSVDYRYMDPLGDLPNQIATQLDGGGFLSRAGA